MNVLTDNLFFVLLAILAVVIILAVLVGLWFIFRHKSDGTAEVLGNEKQGVPIPPSVAPDVKADTTDDVSDRRNGTGVGGSTFIEPETDLVETQQSVTESPEPVGSRMRRLRGRLAKSGALGQAILRVLSRSELSPQDWEEIEESLLVADIGYSATEELLNNLRTRMSVEGSSDSLKAQEILMEELLNLVDNDMDRSLALQASVGDDGKHRPATILVIGVNGTGKTTTIGKLARLLVAEEKSVLLGAADTFRAAAADQLGTWGNRVGVDVVRSDREGADPASVAFDAVQRGSDACIDVVIVDTAGRLQNKSDLMDELGKIKRVMERSGPISEVLLVLDATTGQNGMRQAEVFAEVAGVTGIVLTKLDGSAKGGIVVSVQRELNVPVKFVGLGEGVDDLTPFDPVAFVSEIVGQ